MNLPPDARRSVSDLLWFWAEADGDLGLCSSFPAMVARLQCGGPTGGRPIVEIPEHQLSAATRERRIRRALEAISAERLRVLRSCLDPQATRLAELGSASAVAPLTSAARRAWRSSRSTRSIEEWLVRLCHRVRHGIGERPAADRLLVEVIRRESEAMLLAALRAYSQARRGQDAWRRRLA